MNKIVVTRGNYGRIYLMKEQYRIRDRQESHVMTGAESDISKEMWRYAIVNHNSIFVLGEIIALVFDKAMAEHITQLLNEGDVS